MDSDRAVDEYPDSEFVLDVHGDDGDVTLVGVVHDHPASVRRVRSVLRAYEPTVVALELPQLAVPLYEQYARDGRTPPAFGGEMSAAVQTARELADEREGGGDATSEPRVVGVDAPSSRFLGVLAGRLRRERPPAGVARRLIRGLLAVTRHALVCRFAAVLARRTGLRVEVDTPVEHAVDPGDPPAVQADDERRQLRRGRSLLRLVDAPTVDLRDEVREASMASRLADLRCGADGGVVAVLGYDHLDGVARELRQHAD